MKVMQRNPILLYISIPGYDIQREAVVLEDSFGEVELHSGKIFKDTLWLLEKFPDCVVVKSYNSHFIWEIFKELGVPYVISLERNPYNEV